MACRLLSVVCLCSTLACCCAGNSDAADPDPDNTAVYPWDVVRGIWGVPYEPTCTPISWAEIWVKDSNGNPVSNCQISMDIDWESGMMYCYDVPYDNLYADAYGWAEFCFGFGGCSDTNGQHDIYPSNTLVRRYSRCRSADFDGARGDGRVDLRDLRQFLHEFEEGSTWCCHRVTWWEDDHGFDLTEIIPFTAAYTPAHHCPLSR